MGVGGGVGVYRGVPSVGVCRLTVSVLYTRQSTDRVYTYHPYKHGPQMNPDSALDERSTTMRSTVTEKIKSETIGHTEGK